MKSIIKYIVSTFYHIFRKNNDDIEDFEDNDENVENIEDEEDLSNINVYEGIIVEYNNKKITKSDFEIKMEDLDKLIQDLKENINETTD